MWQEARGKNDADKSLSEPVVEERMLEPEEASAQDTVDMGNSEPFRSQKVNTFGTEGLGDKDVGSLFESHESGVARCERYPSLNCGEARDAVAS